jgi:AcrR family transcriptional regulator
MGVASAGNGPARRRDAERNREAILAAAREAFAEGGVATGVDQIARRAGVGPATLYRHFPSKADLVDAVLEQRAVALCEIVQQSADVTDPADALRDLFHRVVDDQMRDRSFRDLLAWADAESVRDVPALAKLGELIGGIVERARSAGVLRDDAAIEDVLLFQMAFECVSASAGEVAPGAMHRLADVVVDGLLGVRTPLEGGPVPFDKLRGVAASGSGLPPRPAS